MMLIMILPKAKIMIYTTKRFSLKGAALYGGGYIVGGLAGEAVGKKIGEHIKRELGPEDLKKTEAELKELRKFLEVHKNQRFSGLSVRKYEDNPEICRVINLNGVSDDNPDDYDFGMMNKNKAKITKSIQEAIKAKEEILRDPKKHPGNYGNLGRKIGGTIGIGGGLLAAHKLKKFSTAGGYQEVINEPESTKELLKKYPKLNDLKDFINGADKLQEIEFALDDWGIIKDWQSLDCDIAGDDPLEATLFLRKELKSQDWISVLGYGEVGYKISENCFYEIDVYSSRMIKGKSISKPTRKNSPTSWISVLMTKIGVLIMMNTLMKIERK